MDKQIIIKWYEDHGLDIRVFEAVEIIKEKGLPLAGTEFRYHKGQLFITTPHKEYFSLDEEMIDLKRGTDSWIIFVKKI